MRKTKIYNFIQKYPSHHYFDKRIFLLMFWIKNARLFK